MNVHCENKCERVIEQQRHHLVAGKNPAAFLILVANYTEKCRKMQKNERQIM